MLYWAKELNNGHKNTVTIHNMTPNAFNKGFPVAIFKNTGNAYIPHCLINQSQVIYP